MHRGAGRVRHGCVERNVPHGLEMPGQVDHVARGKRDVEHRATLGAGQPRAVTGHYSQRCADAVNAARQLQGHARRQGCVDGRSRVKRRRCQPGNGLPRGKVGRQRLTANRSRLRGVHRRDDFIYLI